LLDNKPGRLSQICSALAKDKISLQALSVMDGKDQSVLHVIVDKVPEMQEVFRRLGVVATESDVGMIELKHQPGALAHLCERLAAEHVNIDYIYCSAGAKNGKVVAVLKAAPLAKVKAIVTENAPPKAPRLPVRRNAALRTR
ncbi:MAG: hypothetical protein ACRC1K_26340, partial [Planctomycetia bacterium]